jgi:hypothetical protein
MNSVQFTVVLLLASGVTACCGSSQQKPPPPATTNAPAEGLVETAAAAEPVRGQMGAVVTAQAKVTAVDLEMRRVKVMAADGTTSTIVCGDSVRNLPQVKVGDTVTVSYHESIAWEVKKPGEADTGTVEVAAGAGRAKEGQMPAAGMGAAVKLTATIVAIDRETMRVTLKGPDGSLAVHKARDPEKLARVKVGDLVEIVYTEAVAISVMRDESK